MIAPPLAENFGPVCGPSLMGLGIWNSGISEGPWDMSSAWPTAHLQDAFSGAPQPFQLEIKRLHAQIHELEVWKQHAEESMRSYHAGENTEPQMTQTLDMNRRRRCSPIDAARAPGAQLRRAASKSTSSSPSPAAASPMSSQRGGSPAPSLLSALSSLPAPIRLPLGPEPVAPGSAESGRPFPPGLLLPLGLTLARAVRGEREDGQLPSKISLPAAAAESDGSQGVAVGPTEVNGHLCARAEWKIEDLRGKLQASMGRPLVSPPFAASGLPNLRLMVFPDAKDAVKGVRSRERKGLYAAMVKKGPLYGALCLKADCLLFETVLRFYLTVGAARQGPFTFDFSEKAIHGCDDFGADWLKQIDEATGNLSVGVEIFAVERSGMNHFEANASSMLAWPQVVYAPGYA